MISLPTWTLVAPSGARQAVTLPTQFPTDPARPGVPFVLETVAHIPAKWAGGPVTLAIPVFYGDVALTAAGRSVPSDDLGLAHSFRIDDAAKAGNVPLRLELDGHFFPVLPGAPRLSPTRHGDAAFVSARNYNFISVLVAVALGWLLAVVYLVVFALDRRRREYGWAAVMSITGPMAIIGDALTLPHATWLLWLVVRVGTVVVAVAVVGFFRAYFLQANWSWKWAPAVAIPAALSAFPPQNVQPIAFLVVASGVLVGVAYAGFVALKQLENPDKRFSAATLLMASLVVVAGVLPEMWANVGRGELLGGLRTLALCAIIVYTVLAAILGRDFIQAMRDTEARVVELVAREQEIARLNEDLRHQVADRSRELTEVLAHVETALPPAALAVGDVFEGRYNVIGVLGKGGMGAVYEVERVRDGRRLALKVVTKATSGRAAARFAREAEIGVRVQHPNLVAIIDVGVAARGTPFLLMELVQGRSMEDARERFGDEAWARPILRQIADGLAELHAADIVHRDLKPANVLLVEEEGSTVARISDFGISRFGALDDSPELDVEGETVRADSKPNELTQTGALLGTPLYMPPEAASAAARSPSVDMFAFGVLAYEALAGRPPFAVPPLLLSRARRSIPAPAPLGGVDERVAEIVIACLSIDPSFRPRAKDVVEELAKE